MSLVAAALLKEHSHVNECLFIHSVEKMSDKKNRPEPKPVKRMITSLFLRKDDFAACGCYLQLTSSSVLIIYFEQTTKLPIASNIQHLHLPTSNIQHQHHTSDIIQYIQHHKEARWRMEDHCHRRHQPLVLVAEHHRQRFNNKTKMQGRIFVPPHHIQILSHQRRSI